MYCGNNALKENSGTNYSCMRKGIGVGLHKNSFDVYLKKTNKPKIYCGDKPILPTDAILGNLSDCLRKGVGVGMGISFRNNLDDIIRDVQTLIEKNL